MVTGTFGDSRFVHNFEPIIKTYNSVIEILCGKTAPKLLMQHLEWVTTVLFLKATFTHRDYSCIHFYTATIN